MCLRQYLNFQRRELGKRRGDATLRRWGSHPPQQVFPSHPAHQTQPEVPRRSASNRTHLHTKFRGVPHCLPHQTTSPINCLAERTAPPQSVCQVLAHFKKCLDERFASIADAFTFLDLEGTRKIRKSQPLAAVLRCFQARARLGGRWLVMVGQPSRTTKNQSESVKEGKCLVLCWNPGVGWGLKV